jgi:hypothetical protein
MKRFLASLVLSALVVMAGASARAEEKGKAEPMIVHDVYFTLKDNSAAAKDKLVAACKKYLTDHPGSVYFAAGIRAEEMKRSVNDLEFDVSLHIVFKDKAAHDKYEAADRHKQFIEENKDNWKKVRVFDSAVVPVRAAK